MNVGFTPPRGIIKFCVKERQFSLCTSVVCIFRTVGFTCCRGEGAESKFFSRYFSSKREKNYHILIWYRVPGSHGFWRLCVHLATGTPAGLFSRERRAPPPPRDSNRRPRRRLWRVPETSRRDSNPRGDAIGLLGPPPVTGPSSCKGIFNKFKGLKTVLWMSRRTF